MTNELHSIATAPSAIAKAFDSVLTAVTFVAHLCTSILGIVAIYALIKNRGKIGAFVRLLTHSVLNERIKRIKGTLGELD